MPVTTPANTEVLALVLSLDSLLAARAASNLGTIPRKSQRFLVAQGIGNVTTAALGGIAISAGLAQTAGNFRAGGRTRLSVLASAALLFAVATLMPKLLGMIPLVALCAVLLVNGIAIFDRWSVKLLTDALSRGFRKDLSSAWKNLRCPRSARAAAPA